MQYVINLPNLSKFSFQQNNAPPQKKCTCPPFLGGHFKRTLHLPTINFQKTSVSFQFFRGGTHPPTILPRSQPPTTIRHGTSRQRSLIQPRGLGSDTLITSDDHLVQAWASQVSQQKPVVNGRNKARGVLLLAVWG